MEQDFGFSLAILNLFEFHFFFHSSTDEKSRTHSCFAALVGYSHFERHYTEIVEFFYSCFVQNALLICGNDSDEAQPLLFGSE